MMLRSVMVSMAILTMACGGAGGPSGPDYQSLAFDIFCFDCVCSSCWDLPPFEVGQTRTIRIRAQTPTFPPLTVSCPQATWSSSAPSVATVLGNNKVGIVTALSAGTTTVTVVAECGSYGQRTSSLEVHVFPASEDG